MKTLSTRNENSSNVIELERTLTIRTQELSITDQPRRRSKLLYISGERMLDKILFDKIYQCKQRRAIVNALSSNKSMTLNEINSQVDTDKSELFRNIQILKRIGVVSIQRKGRKAAYKLESKVELN